MNVNLIELIKDVEDSWKALFHGLGMNGDKKTALSIMKKIIEAETRSMKLLKFEKREIFLGDMTPKEEIKE